MSLVSYIDIWERESKRKIKYNNGKTFSAFCKEQDIKYILFARLLPSAFKSGKTGEELKILWDTKEFIIWCFYRMSI